MILKRVLIIALLGSLVVGAFFGARKVMELTGNRSRTSGEVSLVQRGFVPLGQWGKRDTERRESSREVIVIGAEEVRIVKDTDFFQEGDIIVEDNGKLIFENSVVEMSPKASEGGSPRANIFVRDKGEIVFESSTLKSHADDPRNLYVNLSDEGRFVFNDSQGTHMLIASGNAKIEMDNSVWAYTMPNFRGGGVQVRDAAQANIANSIIGGLIVEFPRDARVDIRDFEAGKFEEFNMKEDFNFRNVDFNVVLQNTEILGDYYEGGSERGLSIFAPSDIRALKISDSELNKFVLVSTDEDIGFDRLKLGTAQDFSYRNIQLINSKVTTQWGFFMHGGKGTFTNSEGLWFFIYGDAKLTLKNSEMNRFDPRDFRGVIDFENAIWKNAGEIIGNNDFTWRGSWFSQGFAEEDFRPLFWDDSRVFREFFLDVFGLDPEPIFVSAAKVEVFDGDDKLLLEAYTNNTGRAEFSILFDDTNYKEKFTIKVVKGDREIKHSVNFLTPSPIKLILK